MAASAADIATIRRMTAVTVTDYPDSTVASIIENHPVADAAGHWPLTVDGLANADWTPRYDLHAAAADIWEEKASILAARFDFSADGSSYQRSQAYTQAMQQSRWHRSRRMMGTHKAAAYPPLEQEGEE